MRENFSRASHVVQIWNGLFLLESILADVLKHGALGRGGFAWEAISTSTSTCTMCVSF